jgi:peptide subunit release factor 1 (eRF1)
MLTDTDLHELLNYTGSAPVLSVYLSTEPEGGNADAYRLRLRNMLKEVNLPEDEAAIQRYFEIEHGWNGRSVAVFSSNSDGFFKAIPLAVPLRSRARVSDRPFVKPLADLLDAYGGYGVALVDSQGARLFYFHLGELREQEGVLGETVRHTKRGGGSSAPGRRGGEGRQSDYVEELEERNMKEMVDFAVRFFAENNVRRVLIGGTEENIAQFRSQLPKSWISLVVGTFAMSMSAGHAEVLEKAMTVGAQAETRREAHLVETLITNAAKGRGGVIDLQDTLDAVREGRIQTLVIRDGYRAPGYRCTSCGYLAAAALEACPFCGATIAQIPDAAEYAVREVMQTGGDVEVLHTDQSPAEFREIGAILRY